MTHTRIRWREVTAAGSILRATAFARSAALLVAVASAALASPVAAQLIKVPTSDAQRRPISAHASAGYFLTQNRFDGTSGVTWFLGDGWQYRVGADLGIKAGSIGIAGTFAEVPIQRGSNPASNGTIQLRQLLATFRSPEPRVFGQVIEVGLGLSQWAGYSGSDAPLSGDDAKARNGVAIALGYGFAFPMGSRFSAQLTQDYTTVIGSREGLPAGARRSQEQYTTRIGLRWRATGARE